MPTTVTSLLGMYRLLFLSALCGERFFSTILLSNRCAVALFFHPFTSYEEKKVIFYEFVRYAHTQPCYDSAITYPSGKLADLRKGGSAAWKRITALSKYVMNILLIFNALDFLRGKKKHTIDIHEEEDDYCQMDPADSAKAEQCIARKLTELERVTFQDNGELF